MKKRFDCVEMKRKAQEEIARNLEGRSVEDQLAYWQDRNVEFHQWKESLRSSVRRAKNSAVAH